MSKALAQGNREAQCTEQHVYENADVRVGFRLPGSYIQYIYFKSSPSFQDQF